VQDNFDIGVDAIDRGLGGFGFWAADVRCAVNDLALEIGKVNGVEIDDADFADTGGGQVHRNGRAESAGADADDAGGADFFLTGQADFGQNQMARVAANFVIIQLHTIRGRKSKAGGPIIKGMLALENPMEGKIAQFSLDQT
jgi:hypothetical protein